MILIKIVLNLAYFCNIPNITKEFNLFQLNHRISQKKYVLSGNFCEIQKYK